MQNLVASFVKLHGSSENWRINAASTSAAKLMYNSLTMCLHNPSH